MSYPSNKLEDDLGHMLNTWQQLQLHTSHIKSINYRQNHYHKPYFSSFLKAFFVFFHETLNHQEYSYDRWDGITSFLIMIACAIFLFRT